MVNQRKVVRKQVARNGSERSLIRRMLKEHDLASREMRYKTAAGSGTFASAGAVLPLTQSIVQGDDIEQREGMQINVTKLTLYIQGVMNVNATTENVRILVFKDLQCRGAVPAVTDVLDSAVTVSGYNVYYRQSRRFKIYIDERIPMSIAGSNRMFSRTYSFNTGMTKVSYLGATDAAGSNGPNQMFVLLIDDLGANNGTYTYGWGISYFDS